MSKDIKPVTSADIVCFIDNQRSIMGELVKSSKDSIEVKNPAGIHLQPTETGQIQVQIFPLWFGELLSNKQREEGTVWSFNKNSITLPAEHIEIEERLITQYNRTFGLIAESQIVSPANNKIIKLFDDN
jgi:hypothetical protein